MPSPAREEFWDLYKGGGEPRFALSSSCRSPFCVPLFALSAAANGAPWFAVSACADELTGVPLFVVCLASRYSLARPLPPPRFTAMTPRWIQRATLFSIARTDLHPASLASVSRFLIASPV